MFKTAIFVLAPLVAMSLPGFASHDLQENAEQATYTVDKAHSQVGFKVRHLGISNVHGEFSDYDATVQFDEGNIESLSVTAEINVASVDTGNDRRDNDLRSDNFFSAETYPEMTFVSKRVENVDGSEFDLVGDLTIRDVTKEVVLESEFLGISGNKAGFTASTKILRKEFGLTWDKVTEAGGIVVSNEVTITLEMELVKQ